ncbi:glutathione S-transferase C-terminal-like protein [Coniophora puteana RWD-64-598 SS2]|uniref:Glutathione S-transferase C-terminal-like protein n=1 Tax=Coniophora puteana (strain RWD-64-598) TaxID=741705 RepID=R7SE98_CONPW|nr:glutathione S-transferase C-terminal-like protein [Coniophora puteana RWD-64-598 SS2]EIW74072.1 glutathione S-transferase C-terminal-like protein [Coniophora puteana RWD-64-598 SS2]
MPEQLTHYGSKISVFAQRTAIALREVNAEYTDCDVDFDNKPDWFFRASPVTTLVPVIAYGGPVAPPEQPSAESAKISESAVILEFIAELFPSAAGLLPKDPVKRAAARLFVKLLDTKLVPPQFAWMQDGAPPDEIFEVLQTLQTLLPEDGQGKYAVGDEFTIADAALAPMWARIRLIVGKGIGAKEWGREEHIAAASRALESPELARFVAYADRLLERPSVKATWYEDLNVVYWSKKAAAHAHE